MSRDALSGSNPRDMGNARTAPEEARKPGLEGDIFLASMHAGIAGGHYNINNNITGGSDGEHLRRHNRLA